MATPRVYFPMPIPGTRAAPKFKGKKVMEFIRTIENLAAASHIGEADVASYVPQYCTSAVRRVIEKDKKFKNKPWDEARQRLIKLYKSEDDDPVHSPEHLRMFSRNFREKKTIRTLRDADRYLRKFQSIATPLLDATTPMVTIDEVDSLFYQGLPDKIRKRVRKRVPEGDKVLKKAPTVDDVHEILQTLFNEEDIDARPQLRKSKTKHRKDSSSSSESSSSESSESESSDNDSDSDSDWDVRPKKTSKIPKRRTSERTEQVAPPPISTRPIETRVPAAPVHDVSDIPTISQITHQLEQLKIAVAQQSTNPMPRNTPAAPYNGAPPLSYTADSSNRTCFICKFENGTHRLGTQNCPEAAALISEGLAAYSTTTGRLVRHDGTDLPRTTGSIATALRNERSMSSDLKGKARAGHDLPPHMANSAGLLCNGIPFLEEGGSSSFYSYQTSISQPVTRSQTNNNRHNPIQRPQASQSQDQQERLTIKLPARPPKPTIPPTPPATSNPTPQTYVAPPAPQVPPTTAVQPPENVSTPPVTNTREGWKKKRDNKAEDVEMVDLKDSAPKTGTSFRLTNEIQKLVDLDTVFKRMLGSSLTMTVAEMLAMSPEMQKRITSLTKLQKEYTSKTVRFLPTVAEGGDDGDDDIYNTSPVRATLVSNSNIRMAIDPGGDSDDLGGTIKRFANMVKAHSDEKLLLAMSTGRFQGLVNGVSATFMIDSGSELNLIPLDFFRTTGIPLDMEGQRWSLVGINGVTTPLAGCARNVPIEFGGHRFDHHFFVNGAENSNGDIILGQPWLQWHSVSILYSREGMVNLEVYKRGNRDKVYHDQPSIPTVTVQICSPNSSRNTNKLHKCSHRATIEEITDDEGN